MTMTTTTRSTEALPVSVLIPAYNRARLLERALRSVNNQTRPPDQVIVVDDASTDDTPQVAEALGAELIRHGRNLGPSATYETGLRAVRHRGWRCSMTTTSGFRTTSRRCGH